MRSDASTHRGYDRAVVDALLDRLLARRSARKTPRLIGISGLQGSGKSTLARQLAAAARERGVAAETLALDDVYLGRRERSRLARDVHPLLATRGVPGTHDLALLARTIEGLAHASATTPARIPRFDKGRDTRLPPSRWRRVIRAPQLVLLEGWCVGAPPEPARALAKPLNDLERREDVDGLWRTWVNARLATDYAALWKRLDALVLLEAPDFSVVRRWRSEQERPLIRTRAPHALTPSKLRRFIQHYERISLHALRMLPTLADVRIVLDANRKVIGWALAHRS